MVISWIRKHPFAAYHLLLVVVLVIVAAPQESLLITICFAIGFALGRLGFLAFSLVRKAALRRAWRAAGIRRTLDGFFANGVFYKAGESPTYDVLAAIASLLHEDVAAVSPGSGRPRPVALGLWARVVALAGEIFARARSWVGL